MQPDRMVLESLLILPSGDVINVLVVLFIADSGIAVSSNAKYEERLLMVRYLINVLKQSSVLINEIRRLH